MQRREFLKGTAAGLLASAALGKPSVEAAESSVPLAKKMPRWRGFNLLEKFNGENRRFSETDFGWIHEWGFDFVRLPLDYLMWTDSADPQKLKENVLKEIDEAVEFGHKHGVHVNLCLHRAPGYTVAKPPEKLDLWTSDEAQRQFDFQWSQFGRRYQGIPSERLSFNLVNEPGNVSPAKYSKVVRRVVAAIRKEDPSRLITADGLQWGRDPVMELADLGIAESTRGYDPFSLTHYKASWVDSSKFARPTWPLEVGGKKLDREYLFRDRIVPWKKLEAKGVGIHVGEWGAFNRTPHDVLLSWATDMLRLWKDAGWGWARWNFRGGFGVLDSDRSDVRYEDFHGHRLDRRFLEVLQES